MARTTGALAAAATAALLLLLLLVGLAGPAGSEIIAALPRVDDPIPLTHLSSVAGYRAKLPCDLTLAPPNQRAFMLFWYKSEKEGSPIYSVDGRSTPLILGRQWSNPHALADRASMKLTEQLVELYIDRLMPEDAGIYQCRIDYRKSPTKHQRVNLTVIVPPQSPVIYTSDRALAQNLQPLDEDSELMLICEVSGGAPPPRVTWHWDGQLVDETFAQEHENVTVNRLDKRRVTRDLLSARLVCQASNTPLVQPATAEIIIDVNLKPLVVNITNKMPYLSASMTYEIRCISSGSRPKAVITWWKGTHQVKDMAKNFAEGPNMTISLMSYAATIEDDGKFLTCRAENPLVSNSALEDRWQLVIHYVPLVTIKLGASLRASDINEGDDVYFECEVRANPRAYKLAWYKDGKELHHNPAANVVLPGGRSLVLQSVSRASAGEYSCMAANYEGKAVSQPVALEVMYAPICKHGASTQVVGALKHETISLVCGVQSKPPPTTFQWTFNNSGELTSMPASRYAQMKPQYLIANHWHGSRMNYTPTSELDYGTIACQATNQIGAQKVPCLFQIIVAGKPYSLQNCSALQSTGPYAYRMGHEDFKATDARDAEWLIVRCTEGFDGGLPITSFELEVYSDENVHHVNTIYINHTDKGLAGSPAAAAAAAPGPVFEVPGLEPGRNYRLLIYAVNAKGRSDPVVLEPVALKGVAMYTTGRNSGQEPSADYSFLVACFAGGLTAVCMLVVGVTLTLYKRGHDFRQSIKAQTNAALRATASATAVSADARRNEPADEDSDAREDRRQLVQQRNMQFDQSTLGRQSYELHQHQGDLPKNTYRAFEMSVGSAMTTSTFAGISNPHPLGESAEEDPDVIPLTKVERRPDIFEPNYAPKPERIRDFRRHLQDEDLNYQLGKRDCWLLQNGGCQILTEEDETALQSAGSPSMRPSTLSVHRSQDIYTRRLRVQESCI